MKKIAIVIPNLQSGGSERIASRLSIALEKKYDVYMILFNDNDISYDYGGQLISLNSGVNKSKLGKVFNVLKRICALRKIVKKNNIDIVCSFVSAADIVNAFCGLKVKRIVSCRGAAYLLENKKLYKKMCNYSDGILFNSEGLRDIYLESYPEDKDKAYVLYNLFDINNIRKKVEEPLSEEENEFFSSHKTVTTVARFVKEKNHWDLLKSFELLKEKVPDAGLMMVGHMGPYEDNIKEMAKQSKYKDDIFFAGYQSNPFKYVKASKVYALSSSNEGFPNSIVEAMAVGTPVVSTNCQCGPMEILFEEKQEIKVNSYTEADYGIITPVFSAHPDFNINNKTPLHGIYAEALEKAMEKADSDKAYERSMEYDEEKVIFMYEKLFENL